MHRQINIAFDFRSDTPTGKDPDVHSPTLRRYHKHLWSKSLPGGAAFQLNDTTPRAYLHHRSEIGEYFLSSDCVIPSFRKETRLSHIFARLQPGDLDAFVSNSYTIGGMMVFPGNCINGKMTINGARGFHPRIKDRFDLTVECIRRHYSNDSSPLGDTLARYADFFRLFGDFRGYIEFFLLQDLVTDDYSAVRFFMPFEDFNKSPLPNSIEAYIAYKGLAMSFIEARNQRILESGQSRGLGQEL